MNETTRKLMTVEEAAEYIGYAKRTLYKMKSQGKIAAYKPTARKLFFAREDLDVFLNSGREKSNSELSLEAEKIISKKLGGRR